MSDIPLSLKSKFELCLNNDDLSDCEFLVGKEKIQIKGHKLLFGISSPIFRAMLYEDSKNVVTFKIEDIEADEFNCIKQFFYTDSVNLTSSIHACKMYLASWKFVIPDLMSKCVKYIKDKISVTDAIGVYEFSCKNNIPDIQSICTTIFQDKTSEIMQSEQFLSANMETLKAILKLDILDLKNELEVFKCTEKWILAEAERKNIDLQKQEEHFNSVTRLIRFSTMDKDQYKEGPAKSDLLTDQEKLSIIHKLLGIESKDQVQLSASTKHRIFTRNDELGDYEKAEGKEEVGVEGKEENSKVENNKEEKKEVEVEGKEEDKKVERKEKEEDEEKGAKKRKKETRKRRKETKK